jgi:hypothetical protein
MRLTHMFCDGCGRRPNLWEWMRGELSQDGYAEWRHPGIAFRAAGCPLGYENRRKVAWAFSVLFNRPMPEELSHLCPQCNARAEMDLPTLLAQHDGQERTQLIPPPGPYLGR